MRILRNWPLSQAFRCPHLSRKRFLQNFIRPRHSQRSFTSQPSRHACAVPTNSTNAHALIPTIFHNRGSIRDETQRPVPLPPSSERGSAASWAKLIEPYLPVNLRKSATDDGGDLPQDILTSRTDLIRLILTARSTANIGILAHLGLDEDRWEAVLWLSRVLYETPPPSSPLALSCSNTLSNMNWPYSRSLDSLTSDTFTLDYCPISELGLHHPLTGYISSKESTLKATSVKRSQAALGEIWQTLGKLIFAAADEDTHRARMIMSHVLRIIADLHHKGWIPANVYRFYPNDDPSILKQPPLLRAVSSRMLSVLSDAVFIGQDKDLTSTDLVLRRQLQSSRGRELGPELWMEFVLWCCVHGSWLFEGASILDIVRTPRLHKNPWSLINWRDTQQPADTKVGAAIFERKISTEVVAAVTDGLISKLACSGGGSTSHSIARTASTLTTIRAILHTHRMILGGTNWDAVVARLIETPEFEVENNPRLMEMILKLGEVYGGALDKFNAPCNNEETNPFASYVLEPSAAIIGFYHRTLHAYIKSRDINGALKSLRLLQNLTDMNKTRSIDEFIAKLLKTDDRIYRRWMPENVDLAWIGTTFPGVHYPGFYPNIPVNILADLLDLITDSQAFEIGKWMIYSTDVDGPMIQDITYGNQTMAPALIRFAATTSDVALLSKLMKAQTTAISTRTLVALCDGRIQEGFWQGVVEVLGLIRDYSLYTWTAEDFALLLRPLLVQILKGTNPQSRGAESSQASLLLQRLLRGDLGQVWGPRFSQCDGIAGVLSSICPLMARVCSGMLVRGRYYSLDMSDATFDLLLQGTTDALGSRAGWQLWKKWCSGTEDQRQIKLPKTSALQQSTQRLSASQTFFGQHSRINEDPSAEIQAALFTGSMTKRINSLRIIIQQALQEARSTAMEGVINEEVTDSEKRTLDDTTPRHRVLDLVARTLRMDFDMSEADIDYELEGYLTSQNLALPVKRSYSAQTLSIWKAFSGSRRHLVRDREQRLRKFVNNVDEKQIVFEHVPPAERYLLHCLAADFGLVSKSFGEHMERVTKITKKAYTPPLPTRTVGEVIRHR